MQKLLCLSYAGGSAQVFKNKLSNILNADIEVVPIELPGRGCRFNEPFIKNFKDIIGDVLIQVKKHINNDEYALLGYSMGSRIVYELYYEILKRGWKLPKIIFFCASVPPAIPYEIEKTDDISIINLMRRYGGTKDILLTNNEFMEIAIPIMRADIELLESYSYVQHKEKIKCPIIVQYGNKDYDVVKYLNEWRNYANNCTYIEYNGGHFFMNFFTNKFANVICKFF